MHRPFFDWVDAMKCVARARVALRNLDYDYTEERAPRSLVHRFLRFVDREWKGDAGDPDEIVRAFGTNDPETIFCQGQPAPKRPRRAGCSRVIDARTLWQRNLKRDVGGYDLNNDIPDAEIRRLEKNGLMGLTKGEMKTAMPFAWVTWTVRVDRLRKRTREQKQFADSLRNHLGLTNYVRGEKLVEVRYPSATVKSMFLAPPTFVEGTPGLAFFSVKKPDGWGRTRHLQTREEAFPEAVHRPVAFTGDFNIRYVGQAGVTDVEFDSEVDEHQISRLRQIADEDESE